MIGFKHYYKSEEMIGTGDYAFRRISSQAPEAETDERFIAYVNGTLEELLPEDFGNITETPEYLFPRETLRPSEFEVKPFKITLPDTITTIGNESFMCNNIKEIVFPSNIKTIGNYVMSICYENSIADFSKAKSIPTIVKVQHSENDFSYQAFNDDNLVTIKVPNSLYSQWITADGWSDLSSKIVSV